MVGFSATFLLLWNLLKFNFLCTLDENFSFDEVIQFVANQLIVLYTEEQGSGFLMPRPLLQMTTVQEIQTFKSCLFFQYVT